MKDYLAMAKALQLVKIKENQLQVAENARLMEEALQMLVEEEKHLREVVLPVVKQFDGFKTLNNHFVKSYIEIEDDLPRCVISENLMFELAYINYCVRSKSYVIGHGYNIKQFADIEQMMEHLVTILAGV